MALAVVANLNSQGYTSTLLDYDRVPNASHFIEIDDGNFLIRSLNSVDDTAATSLIIVDSLFDVVEIIDYKNILFTRNCPLRDEASNYHFFATDAEKEDTYLFGILDQDFYTDTLTEVIYDVEDGGATAFDYFNGHTIGALANYSDCNGKVCGYVELLKIKTDDETVGTQLDPEENYYFTFEVDHLADGHIITGGNRYSDDLDNAIVYKLTPDGNIVWKYYGADEQSRGNVPVWVEELSDGNIIYSDKIKDSTSLDRPTKIVWLSPQGEYIRQWEDETSREEIVEISGIQKGKGGYFFVYGNTGYETAAGESAIYGYIYKFDNDGTVIWQHWYGHSEFPTGSHNIRDLIELDNGDIVTLGRANIPGEQRYIWMMRLDEHGCFGTSDCGEEVISTSTTETVLPATTVVLYPSPATNELHVHADYHGRYSSASIYSPDGTTVYQQALAHDATIDISSLLPGSYIAILRDTDGLSHSQKIVVY